MARKAKEREPLTDEQRALIEKDYYYLLHLLKLYNIEKEDYDDVLGVCHLALCNAARTHDPTKSEFRFTMIKYVGYAIANYRRANNKYQDRNRLVLDDPNILDPDNTDTSETTLADLIPYHDNMEEGLILRDCYDRTINKIWKKTKDEQLNRERNIKIVNMRLLGYKSREIAEKFNVTRQRVDLIYSVFQDAFKKEYEGSIVNF